MQAMDSTTERLTLADVHLVPLPRAGGTLADDHLDVDDGGDRDRDFVTMPLPLVRRCRV